MFKINHYIITIVSLFCSLAIGILMGMSMGDDILVRQQEEIIYRLEKHFDELAEENERLIEEKQELSNELEELQQARNDIKDTYNDVVSENNELFVMVNERPLSLEHQLETFGLKDYRYLDQTELKSLNENDRVVDYLESTEIVIILGPEPETFN
ncbi:DUF349 domain-containing protein [Natranaerobius thermophilus]|uniref:Uncharacterized protein n=1 Tax=Natranaerobius thermophilus (strain ATCC BAA-1301 / DSM 18059 / JW/NM-WN-LF) TaxID=457570 RepID=B2A518_NATTJ|nr:DUF349 domain-containing protein [Natranaerobius thermophilus]ACB85260.1 hypothetical protein Nther_1686 [Natranaerobius thermophilus JW/NM-WN-LF]